MDVTYTKSIFVPAATVDSILSTVGTVLIESELSGSSFQVDAAGATVVDLGEAQSGVYVVRFIAETDSYTACLAFLPQNGELELFELNVSGASRTVTQDEQKLVDRFISSLSADILSQAAKEVFPTWLGSNSVGVTSTVLICTIPGSAAVCLINAGSQGVDLGFAILVGVVAILVADGVVSKEEGTTLKNALGVTNLGAQIILGGGVGDRLLALLGGAELLVDQPSTQLGIKFSTDSAKKLLFLFELRPK